MVEGITAGGSTVRYLKIRNAGSECVDVRDFRVTAAGDTRLELVHGSFDLEPGETAFIATNSQVDVNHEGRIRIYTNTYRAVGSDGSVVSLRTDSFRLMDGSGAVLGIFNPDIMSIQGNCCNDDDCCVSPSDATECCTSPMVCGQEGKFDQTQQIVLGEPPDCTSCGAGCEPCP